jgi:hypothetical protein
MEAPPVDLVPALSGHKDIVVRPYDELGYPFILHFNQLQALFNDVEARKAVLAMVKHRSICKPPSAIPNTSRVQVLHALRDAVLHRCGLRSHGWQH